MNLPLLRRSGWWLLLLVVSTLGVLGLASPARATHIRAGDIQAKTDTTPTHNPRRFFFKMVLYTDAAAAADTREAVIFFGDGTRSEPIPRKTKALLVGAASDSYISTFFFEHTYNAAKTYKVAYVGENRKTGVKNMSSSEGQSFYIYTQVTIDPALALVNHSPVLFAPALDKASVRQVFLHNPAAYDADGDSLSFELQPSRQVPGGENAVGPTNQPAPVTCTGFTFPNSQSSSPGGIQVPYTGPPKSVDNDPAIFVMDNHTGQLVWNAPSTTTGDYNVAFVVREWRKGEFGVRLMGEVLRDMQITVNNANNLRPTLIVPKDICVVAGVPITKTITATDPDNNAVNLYAYGGIFPPHASPASFVQSQKGPPTARGIFRWTPTCADVATQPYQVLFKAEDIPTQSGGATALIDERSWRIKVVGPPPQNVKVGQLGSTAVLTWDQYTCADTLARILIYRKEGCTTSAVDTCQTGIAPGSGFVKIDDISNSPKHITYTDTNNGTGLKRGTTYSYRIYVEFAGTAGGASLASREACVTLDGTSPLLKNVTVDRTDAVNGQITVKWTKPTASGGFIKPGYNLYRAVVSPTPTFTLITPTPKAIEDTVLVDQGLNTLQNAYSYRLEFFSNILNTPNSPQNTERVGPATSVRLEGKADPVGLKVTLTWAFSVPWDNTKRPVTIFRRDASNNFVPIGTAPTTATGGTFVDSGTPGNPLKVGSTYCYYVQTDGTYGKPDQHLINLSQELCVVLREIPCIPVLKLKAINCDSLQAKLFDLEPTPVGGTYTNYLSWKPSDQPTNCSSKIANYRLYYRPSRNQDGTDTTGYKLIATLPGLSYAHVITNPTIGLAGCYFVVAVDAAGTVSGPSNVACNDNCPLFLLPNIFTPNGDGKNDKFRPKVASPIRRTHFQVFNRWGVKVYESSADPLINWDGGGVAGEGSLGVKVVEGVYYYLAEVEFADFNNTKRTYKGWVEIKR